LASRHDVEQEIVNRLWGNVTIMQLPVNSLAELDHAAA
jgi:hypothetical protein